MENDFSKEIKINNKYFFMRISKVGKQLLKTKMIFEPILEIKNCLPMPIYLKLFILHEQKYLSEHIKEKNEEQINNNDKINNNN